MSPKLKKWLGNTAKLALTVVAMVIVWKKIDPDATWDVIKGLQILPFLLALAFFNFSKVLSAFRLQTFFQAGGNPIGTLENLRLYYIGMFYNLFLPGGIGGDGYKVYRLNKKYNYGVKSLLASTLLDRLSGLVALLALAACLAFFSPNWEFFRMHGLQLMLIIACLLLYPLWFTFLGWLFPSYLSTSPKADAQSLGVQLFQVLSALAILFSLGVDEAYLSYLFLFLISSVVAVVPFTIGGVGARELVMVVGVAYLPIDANTAVAFTLLFFLITALSSFFGIFLRDN